MHLGLHWAALLRIAEEKLLVVRPSKVWPVLLLMMGSLIAVYGMAVIDMRNFAHYLFLYTEFVFLGFNESQLYFCLDCLSVLGLIIFFVQYGLNFLRRIGV